MKEKNVNILLINTPSLDKRPVSRSMAGGLGFDSGESMILPPLDLAIMASRLRSKGQRVDLLDADPLRYTEKQMIDLVRDGQFSSVVATVSLPTLLNDCTFISNLRGLVPDKVAAKTMIQDKEILKYILDKSGADFVIYGECDLSIDELLEGTSTKGAAFYRDGSFTREDGEPVQDLDNLPFPSWDLLPYAKYTYPLLGDGMMTMQTSRGCPFPCSYYCPYPLVEGKAWRSQSPGRVFKEIKEIVTQYNIKKILFRDATFTLDKQRVHQICDLIIADNLDVRWWCETRVDCLDDELLEKMNNAGCAGINIGVETGDQRVVQFQAKRGLTLKKLTHLREKAKALGFRLHFLLSVGFPEETKTSIVDTFDLIQDLQPESLGITVMTPYPGTPLFKEAENKQWIESKNWEEYGGHQFVMHTDKMSREDMDRGFKYLVSGYGLLKNRYAGIDDTESKRQYQQVYTNLLTWALDLDELQKKLRKKELRETGLTMSVVIPTFNRREHLLRCLEKLAQQRIQTSRFEVIVIDDGSTDGTQRALESLNVPYSLRYFYQENKGPATARNRGIVEAKNDIIVFIGDDILVTHDFIAEHLTAHQENPDLGIAVLGHIDWPPGLQVTPFMAYITGAGGQQFAFHSIKNNQDAGFSYFYTSNISLKRPFLLKQDRLFDTDFIYAAYEDTEFGYRLSKMGLRIIYYPEALVYHFHPATLSAFLDRQNKAGKIAVLFAQKHPELDHTILGVTDILHTNHTDEGTVPRLLEVIEELEKPDMKKLAVFQNNGTGIDTLYAKTILYPFYDAALRTAYNTGVIEGARELKTGKWRGSELKVSIIIPVYNNFELTRSCIDAIIKNTPQGLYEIIIVDDASTDCEMGSIDRLYPVADLKVVANESNRGFAFSCNSGAKNAKGKYILFLNNDTLPQSGWLEEMLSVIESDDKTGIVGSRLLYPDGHHVQHAGIAFDRNGLPYHIHRGVSADDENINSDYTVDAVTGACLLISKELFEELLGFDESYGMYFEDVDLCLRAQELGKKVIYSHRSKVLHHESATTGKVNDREPAAREIFLKRWKERLPLINRLLWSAPIYDPSGYSDEARNFVLSINDHGIPVRVNPIKWSNKEAKLPASISNRIKGLSKTPLSPGFINVMHIFPPYFQKNPAARFNIGRTMFETDRIPEEWVAKCNEMDEIWVPTDFNLQTFAAAGVNPGKLFKIPGPHDFSGYSLDVPPLPIEGKKRFSFLSTFDWNLRKGWDILIKAYIEEFKEDEDVTLILKVWSSYGKGVTQLQQDVEKYIREVLSVDPIRIPDMLFLDLNIPVEEMPHLYKAVDAYVMPTRGEGWGRPYIEAMAMELPTIGTRWSGNTEFMNDENSFLIDFEMVDVPEEGWKEVPTYKGHRWAEPSVMHLRSLMRHVFENRNEAKKKGVIARGEVIRKYNGDAIAGQIIHRIEELSKRQKRIDTRPNQPSEKPGIAVCWEGSQFVYHSLALINREVGIELLKKDAVDLSIIPYETHQFDQNMDPRFPALAKCFRKKLDNIDIHIRHQWPPNFNPPPDGRWVLIQPWEFGSLPKAWVPPIQNLIDEVWIPSHYVRQVYIDSGIDPERVHVIPNGINPEIFNPDGPEMKIHSRKGFKFLFVGGTIYRKGIDILINTYLKTFTAKDDVVLVIKDIGSKSFYSGQNLADEIKKIRKNPKAPAIYYIEKDIIETEMASLYRACDCLVHPYRGEGFGLPVLEAMACGLPVIVTSGGSTDDFVDDNTGYRVPSRRTIFGNRDIGNLETVSDTWFLEIDQGSLQEKIRYVMTHPDEARAIGRNASHKVLREFTWQRVTEKYLERMHELLKKPIRRHRI